jgi:hypothetical protein
MRALHLAPVEPLLQVQIKSNQRKCHRDGFRILVGVLGRPGIHHVLVDEFRVAQAQTPPAQIIVGRAFLIYFFRQCGCYSLSGIVRES